MEDFHIDFSDFSEDSDAELDMIEMETPMPCICKQNSGDEMIVCCGENCRIKWYHFNCVGLKADSFPDGGDWACERCVAASADHSDRSGPRPSLASVPSAKEGRKQKSNAKQEDGTKKTGETDKQKEKKGRKSKRPAKVFTEDDAKKEVKSLFKNALAELSCHPIYSGPFANKEKISRLITLLQSHNDEELACFTEVLVSEVWKAICSADNLCLGPEMYERITINIHNIMFNAELRNAWDAATNSEKSIINGIVLMFVIRHVARNMMHLRNEKDNAKEVPTTEWDAMTAEEENVLRYVAGYVPYALNKRYQSTKSAHLCEIISSWIKGRVDDKLNDLVAYTEHWVSVQNRGGLFLVNDDVYNFFKLLEHKFRQNVSKNVLRTFKEVSIKDKVIKQVFESRNIHESWAKLINGALSSKASTKLMLTVVTYFIKIRCRAFVNVYMQIRKKTDSNVSRKKEKSLRKELAK